jgi:hypothetical protein
VNGKKLHLLKNKQTGETVYNECSRMKDVKNTGKKFAKMAVVQDIKK